MPATTILDIPTSEQDPMLATWRRARYGDLLALHVLLLCAASHTPNEIATFLFCARSSVYRIVRANRHGTLGLRHDDLDHLLPPVGTPVLRPWLKCALLALLKARPQRSGWCRTRWSCATLVETLQLQHGLDVSAETIRRWPHELGGVWKRVHLVAKDDDRQRLERLGLIRFHHDHLGNGERLGFADELDIHLVPKVGAQWMPQGSRHEVMTPGQNEKHDLAGALDASTGKLHDTLGDRKHNGLFRELLNLLDQTYPASRIDRIDVVVDNYSIHKAKAVHQWLEKHPRFERLGLPTYGPKANPIEQDFGEVHDKCTRNHHRKRLRDLVQDVEHHVQANGP